MSGKGAVDNWRICGERKWGSGWQKIPLVYGGIIRLRRYYYSMERYSMYIGTASTLYYRGAKITRID